MTRGTGGGCWRCGAETDPTAATCRKCGASSATNRGERKQISVLFCDLVGSTALSGRLDPEELRDLLRSYQDTCARIVERLDGHLAQFLGDGILIYFGYPTSHEDDPARAVEAGLEIADAVSTLQFPQLGGKVTNIGVRVGIHTGLIVAAELGHGPRRETLALGSTPNIAAKLQNVCAANGVCVSAQTCELTRGHFEYDEYPAPHRDRQPDRPRLPSATDGQPAFALRARHQRRSFAVPGPHGRAEGPARPVGAGRRGTGPAGSGRWRAGHRKIAAASRASTVATDGRRAFAPGPGLHPGQQQYLHADHRRSARAGR